MVAQRPQNTAPIVQQSTGKSSAPTGSTLGGTGGSITPPQQGTVGEEGGSSVAEQIFFGTPGKQRFVRPGSQPVTSANQQQSLNDLLQFMQGLVSSAPGAGEFQQFEGQFPGMNELQAMSLAGLEQIAMGDQNVFSGQTGENAQNALNQGLTQGPQDFQDVFDQTVFQPGLRDLTRTLDVLNAAAPGTGNLFSSGANSQREVLARGTQDFTDASERERSRFSFESEQANRENINQLLGLAPSIAGLDLALGREQFAAGSDARAIETEQFASDLAIFQEEQQRKQQQLAMLAQLSAQPTFGVSQGFSLGTQPSADGGLLSSFIGSLLGGSRA